MNWEECLDEKVTKVTPNKEIAISLLKMCKARLEIVKGMPRKYPALVAEVYYEILKELMTAILAINGFKAYSHKCLLAFIEHYYFGEFTAHEIATIDKLRVIRNDVGYRGVFTGGEFLERNEEKINKLICKFMELLESKL